LRAHPTSHKSHPRCTMCIAHHFTIAILKWGSNSKGPAGSIVAHLKLWNNHPRGLL
jgi:hypothetical protein